MCASLNERQPIDKRHNNKENNNKQYLIVFKKFKIKKYMFLWILMSDILRNFSIY